MVICQAVVLVSIRWNVSSAVLSSIKVIIRVAVLSLYHDTSRIQNEAE